MFVAGDFTGNTWICDSGASTHMGNTDVGMEDVEEIDEPIKVGNGDKARAIKKGTLNLTAIQKTGHTMDIKLQDYKYSPELGVCLFSLTKALHHGWTLTNYGINITLTKNETVLTFDRVVRTKDGVLVGIELVPRTLEPSEGEVACVKDAPQTTKPSYVTEDEADDEQSDDNEEESTAKESKPTADTSTKKKERDHVEVNRVLIHTKKKEKPNQYIDINRFHRIMGHAGKDSMEITAKHYGIKLTGTLEACEDCQMSNVTQKAVKKTTMDQSQTFGERLFIDSSTVAEHKSLGGAKVWLCIVDDSSGITWSRLLKKKSDSPQEVMEKIQELNDLGIEVLKIRCDDAGENKSLRDICKHEASSIYRKIKFEFTSGMSPQLNGKVERKIAVITRRVRATLNAAGLTDKLRRKLWGEAVMHCTEVENMLVSRTYDGPSDIPKMLKGIKHLRQFGEIAYVKYGNAIKGKLENRGIPMLYLGKAIDHSADTSRFLNIATERVVNTRNVLWLNKTYGEWRGLKLPPKPETVSLIPLNEEEKEVKKESKVMDVEEIPIPTESTTKQRVNERRSVVMDLEEAPVIERSTSVDTPRQEERQTVPTRTMSTRATKATEDELNPTKGSLRELAKLEGALNPEATSLVEQIRQQDEEESTIPDEGQATGKEMLNWAFSVIENFGTTDDRLGEVLYSVGNFGRIEYLKDTGDYVKPTKYDDLDPSKYKATFEVPMTFMEAWDHPEPFQRKKWRAAIAKEFMKMEDRQVWTKIKQEEMESNKTCVKYKWVFEVKRNGIFRGRLVACGYSQIPGIDFTDVYSPVANDVTFRTVLVAKQLMKLDALIFDIETAFLLGDLDKKIYMKCPDGMVHKDDELLLLKKTIYGLVQSSRLYYKKYAKVMRQLGFERCKSDPCLFMKKDELGICIVLTYVDDNLALGTPRALKKLLKDLKQTEFTFTVEHTLKDYLSCEIEETRKGLWLGQPHMMKKLNDKFGDEVSKLPTYRTPGTPNMRLSKPDEEEKMVDQEEQSLYRTGVGMLMFCVKHSRLDIMNPTRELSKLLGAATPGAMKEMRRIIKYVLDTRELGLKIEPRLSNEGKWTIEVYSDSDWAGDPDDRKSVGCFIILLCGVPIAWRSKGQKVVSLSTAEAEFYACVEAVKEVPFIAQVLLFLGVKVQLPVDVRIDNVGAIFMSENVTSTTRTRHMDARYWWITDMQDEGMIKVDFVSTKENISDIGTKNVTGEVLEKHLPKLLMYRQQEVNQDQTSWQLVN